MEPETLVTKNLRLDKCGILATAQHRGFRRQCAKQRAGEGNLCRAERRQVILDMAGCVIGKRAGQAAEGGPALRPALRQSDGIVRSAGSALIEQFGEGDWLRMFIGHLFRISG